MIIKVLLVDDHRLVRAGLQSLLDASGDIRVVGTAADGQEASTWRPPPSPTWC